MTLSPIRHDPFDINPLAYEKLPDDIQVIKAAKGLLVLSVGNYVVKWIRDSKSQNELKIHYNYLKNFEFILPIIYGRKNEKITLQGIFGKELKDSPEYFLALQKKINSEAKGVLKNFELGGSQNTPSTFMVLEKMDGTLQELLPILKLKGCENLIRKINRVVQNGIEIMNNHRIMHNDTRPRNIFFKIQDTLLKIYLGDFGNSLRLPEGKIPSIDEYSGYERAAERVKAARNEKNAWSEKDIDWKRMIVYEPALSSPERIPAKRSLEFTESRAIKRQIQEFQIEKGPA